VNYLYKLILVISILPAVSPAQTLIDQGRYIAQLANCYSCHTDIENEGKPLAGGRAMETQFGIFYPPNITPDKETGIGNWTEHQFAKAVRSGLAPDGSHYYPTFPYSAYKNISDADIKALTAYMFSLKPVKQMNNNHNLSWFVSRWVLPIWKMLNTDQGSNKSDKDRGAYIVDTLGHCNECHTPRNSLGILQMEQKFSGNEDLSAPDISSESLKDWSKEELIDLFSDGALPSGDYVSDHMAEVVEYSTSTWKPADLKAAIRYLQKQKTN